MNMKKILVVILLFVSFYAKGISQEVPPKPEPLPANQFVFPEYKTVTLSNGLKVFLIKDDEQPTIMINLLVKGGSVLDGKKSGMMDYMSSMLTKGAGKRTALEIAQTLDGIGASVSAGTRGEYMEVSGYSLKKHFNTMFEIFADVVLAPTFPSGEFDKLMDQYIASVKQRKASSQTIASDMVKAAVYGQDHPYAKFMTEESLKSIKVGDLKDIYKKTFFPNNATLAITGDFDEKEIINILEQKFKNWKQGTPPSLVPPEAKSMKRGVYFIPRPGSKQSSVIVSQLTIPRNHPDYYVLDLTGSVMGGSFGAKLFRTLREKYSFTYTPFAYHTSSKYINRFACGAEVKNEKTDSSITIILEQLQSLQASDGLTKEDLDRIKSYKIGSYLMAFENSGYISDLIQGADFYEVPMDQIKNYPQIIQNITTLDISKVAAKYLTQERSYIAVVGLPSLRDSLKKFGPIYEYTLDIKPIEEEKASKKASGISKEQVIENFAKAIGGKEAIKNVKALKIEGSLTLSAQGQSFNGNVMQVFEFPDKVHSLTKTPFFTNEVWIDKTKNKGWTKAQDAIIELTGDQLTEAEESTKFELFELINILDDPKYKVDVKGEKEGMIMLKVVDPNENEQIYYFNKTTGLLDKIETTQSTPQGPLDISIEFKEYEDFKGIKLPLKQITTTPMFSTTVDANYWINPDLSDESFQPK